jgi:ketosteroid isomerase-like protein
MSSENVESARRTYDAFNRRDRDAFVALMDDEWKPSLDWWQSSGLPRSRGPAPLVERFLEVFPDYTLEIEELRDLGDVTLTRFGARARGAGSDAPRLDPVWQPARWRDGRCVWWRVCSPEAEALEAAGLRE